MKRRYLAGIVLALLMIAILPGTSHARAEWDIKKVLKLNTQPLDVAVPNKGNSIFILSKSGKVLIYSFDGQLKDEIDVGNHVDQILAGPSDEWLFLSSRENKTVKIIHIDFIQKIDISGSPFLGPENAPVTIVVFSDFQCPYCARIVPLLKQVLEKNTGKVKLVFKNFPLRMHRYAMEAAIAAMAADKQGKFWKFHDRLFLAHNQLSDQKIREIAESLGLNMAEFDKQMKSPEIRAKIEKDILDGREANVTGTPTVFINGQKVRDWSRNGLQTLINKELNKTKQ